MNQFKRILAVFMSLSMAAGATVQSVGATAGEKPPEIFEDEIVFPDPDSFSYDDVEVNFAKALQYVLYFYDANKCGYDTDPETGKKLKQLEWRGDCHTEDYAIPLKPVTEEGADAKFGTNLSQEFIDENKDILDPDGDGFIDCGGGMHDAGDHVKFGLPGSYAASTLGWGYYEFRDAYKKTETQEHMEDILHWFNDFYMKGTYLDEDGKVIAFCYQVGEGNNDHNYWCPPELQDSKALLNFARPAYFATTETPASDMCAGTAASLAINYLNFKDTEPEYAAESLKKAIALYDFAVETHKEAEDSNKVLSLGYDGGFYNSSYDYDELSWAAVWLNICTGEQHYIDDIIAVDTSEVTISGGYKYTGYLKRIMETTGSTWQNIWVHCWDTVWGGVFAKLAPITNNERDWFIFRWNLEFWSGQPHLKAGGLADEIWNMDYQHIKDIDENDKTYIAKTPAGFSMLNEYGSCRYNTAAGLCAAVYRKETAKFKDEEYAGFTDWAENQMEYIMGKNPMNRPYIVGYSDTAASHPHHRAAHGSSTFSMDDPIDQSHTLWGALVGGPDSKDWHRDITKDYVYNEVAVDYNAGVVGDLAALYTYYGTEDMKPEENFPPKETEGDRYWIEGLINQENIERTQYTVKVHYESKQPPKYLTQSLKARYYFDISELVAKGQSIDDVQVAVYYDEVQSTTDMKRSTKVSDPIHFKDNIYYIEMDWSGTYWRGSRELQVGIFVGQDENYESNWDPTDDYSRKGLVLSDEFGDTDRIPLYFEDELVYGHPPVGDGSDDTPKVTSAPSTTTKPVVTTKTPATTKPPVTTSAGTKYTYGDIDLNGDVDISDLLALSQHLLRDKMVTGKALVQADVNGDGEVDIADLGTLRQYVMKDNITLGPKK